MIINCIVIDDEPLALKQMESFIGRIDYLKHIKSFSNGFEPIKFLKSNQVDLMFLDIHMDDFDGLQLLDSLITKPKVILTTAYDSYALKGYEYSVSDYLLKPISFARFAKACEKIYDELSSSPTIANYEKKQVAEVDTTQKFIFAKSGHVIHKINFDEILYIEGLKEYLSINTLNEKILVLQNFQYMEESLPKNNFIRVHRSFIIAIDKISKIEKTRVKIGSNYIPLGDVYKKVFFDKIKTLGIL